MIGPSFGSLVSVGDGPQPQDVDAVDDDFDPEFEKADFYDKEDA